ncbi:NUDIX hydrolase [Nocardioides sp. zg-ZUI104]|uniref:NUDIX hydrolase n=1 Tax=Nocardioides faecalis TaxID=2803858 RepID=UPI001BCC9A51|nr:NUDIX hydrolase [Nocardioides faecalis]MBS4754671.1 NUDIX hydrolase [Nocardioides faecalis]
MSISPDLDTYPRPGLTVDLAVLTVVGTSDTTPELRVLVLDRAQPAGRALPGGFIRERQTVARTVDDVLRRKVGIDPADLPRPHLLRLFDDPQRDDRTWAISAAHSVSLREADLAGARGTLVPVTPHGRLGDGPPLLFDHDEIVEAAVSALRERYEIRFRYVDVHPDPDGFLSEPFTLHQLRKVHEAVVGAPLHKDNFNRRMKPLLEPLLRDGRPVLSANLRGRPATLYRHRRDADDSRTTD